MRTVASVDKTALNKIQRRAGSFRSGVMQMALACSLATHHNVADDGISLFAH
jgi:hypothetical protein